MEGELGGRGAGVSSRGCDLLDYGNSSFTSVLSLLPSGFFSPSASNFFIVILRVVRLLRNSLIRLLKVILLLFFEGKKQQCKKKEKKETANNQVSHREC